jgi:hypothetical protein
MMPKKKKKETEKKQEEEEVKKDVSKKQGLIEKSFNEYKKDSKKIINFFLKTYALPYLILIAFIIILTTSLYGTPFYDITPDFIPDQKFMVYTSIGLLVSLLILIIYVLFSVTAVYYSLHMEKGVNDILRGGRKYFWKYLGYMVVVWFVMTVIILTSVILTVFLYRTSNLYKNAPVLIGALIVLIWILAIALLAKLFISWIFAHYILVGENKGVIQSLRASYHMVKGRWWKTLGRSLLFILILLAVAILLSMLENAIGLLGKTTTLIYMQIITLFIGEIISMISLLIILPLGVLFFKNLYLDYKK